MANKDFTAIDDEKTVMRYIKYMEDLNCQVNCAVRETDIRFDTTPIRIVQNKIVHLRTKNSLISPKDLEKAIKATKSQRVDISFHAHDILVFAGCKVRAIDKDGISLEVERPIYKLQRRENLRVKPGADIKCRISIFHPEKKKYEDFVPYDISVGGFALVLEEKAAEYYPKGIEFNDISFLFGAHEVRVAAKVKSRSTIKGPRKTNIKLGFEMSSIPVALEQEISRYAYLASQKILGRRI